jgi:hypothetical protein
MSVFSAPARLLVSPFRGYAELANADEGDGRPTVAGGMIRFLFVFGAFVSVTATGRFAPFELVSGIISFSYVPVLHATAVLRSRDGALRARPPSTSSWWRA